MRHPARSFVALGGMLLCLFSCSLKRYQGADEVLYLGTKTIEVLGDKQSKNAEQALQVIEEQLAYPPNNSFLGSSSLRVPLPLVRPWLYLRYTKPRSWFTQGLKKLGTKPIWIKDVNPELRAKVSEQILQEYGYLNAQVSSLIHRLGKDSLSARVSYQVDLGQLYTLDSLAYLPPISLPNGTLWQHRSVSTLAKGQAYSIDRLLSDRANISQALREYGFYFFNPSYVSYEADSLQHPGRVCLRSRLSEGLPPEVMQAWRIGKIRVRLVEAEESLSHSLGQDTLKIAEGITVHYKGHLPIRPKVLNSRIRLRPDSLYRSSLEDLTIKSLGSIGSFTSSEILYTPRKITPITKDTASIMDMTIVMKADKPWHITLGGQARHKSNNFVGPGAVFMLNRRNLWGGGETLSLSANANYEWQIGQGREQANQSYLNSYQLGVDVSLSIPTLLIPGWLDHYFAYPTSTNFKLSGQRLNRASYYGLNTISFAMSYDYQPTEQSKHNIRILGLDYTHLGHTTASFDRLLAANPSLLLSFSNQLIPSLAYSYIWQRKLGYRQRSSLWLRNSLSQAGNLTKALFVASGHSYNHTQQVLGVPYAQFVKASSEVRYTHYIDRYQSLASRFFLGAIYSYGNMLRAPYTEQFYVGGANSLRAFTVRSLGPGRFKELRQSIYTFMDHVGECKLEANIEFRRSLTQSLELALFVDVGNVWLLRRDAERPEASLSEMHSLQDFAEQIAVGTGLGLRYDLSYLLVRLDVGIGLHLPYDTGRNSWYNIPRFSDALGFHIAIGYPF